MALVYDLFYCIIYQTDNCKYVPMLVFFILVSLAISQWGVVNYVYP